MLTFPQSAFPHHRTFLSKVVDLISQDQRFMGVAVSGSYADDQLDKFSDLDIVLAISPEHVDEIMQQRGDIAGKFGPLVASFTGEHVGEPRLLICLYDTEPEPLHVDFKFVALADVAQRVDNPCVLWEKQQCMSQIYAQGNGHYPIADLQWFEDRFWTWLHYGVGKVARGELFEALEFTSFLRANVLGPLAMVANGLEPKGVRKIEHSLPKFATQLESCIPEYNAQSILCALSSLSHIYIALREQLRHHQRCDIATQAQHLALSYLQRNHSPIVKPK